LKATSKRLLALVAGGLGLRALLRRRVRPAPLHSPADELKAKLASSKEPEPPVAPESVDERRADTHARARHAIDELREQGD
jgi:hypothetical protein